MIYLDNNATTKLDNKVLDAMLPYLTNQYGNASSIQHSLGRSANLAIEKSRNIIAEKLKTSPKEIFFNSGSTEAISTVIKGIFQRYKSIGKHIITCKTEHKAVLTACQNLEKEGAIITYLPVHDTGAVNIETLKESIQQDTILVCLMSTNNETGVINPVAEIASICTQNDIIFFCDATQSIGKETIDLSELPIDILCFSAHKFHGPKGIGALFIRRKSKPIQIEPLIEGGKQENGFRGGTYNVSGIVGFGKALEIINVEDQSKIETLRNYLEEKLTTEIEHCTIIAKESKRISNTSNIMFKHVKSSELMTQIPDIAVSSGSACVSGDRDPSHVLTAMGLKEDDALSCIRFSLSKYNNKEEIDMVVDQIKNAVSRIRERSPIWQMFKLGIID